MISLESNTKLQTLYLNHIYLFPNERLTPSLYLLLASLSSDDLQTVVVNLTFEDGGRVDTQVDNVDWNAVDVFLSAESCRSLQAVNINVRLGAKMTEGVEVKERVGSVIREKLWRSAGKVRFIDQ